MSNQQKPRTKNFHFQEIDKIVMFPLEGNQGKYNHYLVQIKTSKTFGQQVQPMLLGGFLESLEVENSYPHTIGYFKEFDDALSDFKPQYLGLRKIYTIEEFWLLLNDVGL